MLPHATLELQNVSVTNPAAQISLGGGVTGVAWFPSFTLLPNATLLLADLTVYSNPADSSEVRALLSLLLHLHAWLSCHATGWPCHAAALPSPSTYPQVGSVLQDACPGGQPSTSEALLTWLSWLPAEAVWTMNDIATEATFNVEFAMLPQVGCVVGPLAELQVEPLNPSPGYGVAHPISTCTGNDWAV